MYFRPIDGLRAIAVLAVVFFHLDPTLLPGGFAGVDIFFVISAFVVTHSLLSSDNAPIEYLSSVLKKTTAFYSRRLARLLPHVLLMLLLVSILCVLFLPSAWLSDSQHQTAKYATVGLSNWYLGSSREAYFEPRAAYNPFVHTWTLGVEIQFYFFLSLVFLVPPKRWTLLEGVWVRKLARTLWFISFFLLALKLQQADDTAIFYSTQARVWELMTGALLRLEYPWLKDKISHRFATVIGYFALASVLLCLGVGLPESAFPWPAGIFIVFFTTLLILSVAILSNKSFLNRCLCQNQLQIIGKSSYAVYLWHWPIIVLMRWTIGIETLPTQTSALLLIGLVSFSSYRFFENPIRRLPVFRIKPGLSVTVLLVFVGASYWSIDTLFSHKNALSLSETKNSQFWRPDFINDKQYPVRYELTSEHKSIGDGQIITFAPLNNNTLSQRTLFVMGDSHATAYIGMLRGYAATTGQRVVLYSLAGCPHLDLIRPLSKIAPHCQAFSTAVMDDVKMRAAPNDILFLPSLRLQRLVDQWPLSEASIERTRILPSDRVEATAHAESALSPLADIPMKILFEAPKPIFRTPAFRCYDPWLAINPICNQGWFINREEVLGMRQEVINSMQTIKSKLPNVYLWDPFEILCPATEPRCPMFQGEMPLYFDGDHLSAFGNRFLFNDFEKALQEL